MIQTDEFIESPLRDYPLPVSNIRGAFSISDTLVHTVFQVLNQQSKEGSDASGNEGLVFLAGMQVDDSTIYTTVIIPRIDNTRGSVFVDAGEYGNCGRLARKAGLQILAQVHSHPGSCCHHSDGDDMLIVMPFEGMLSLVMPHYGRRATPLNEWGVHQRRGRTWFLCRPASVDAAFTVTPTYLVSKP